MKYFGVSRQMAAARSSAFSAKAKRKGRRQNIGNTILISPGFERF
jgi:hypothetical protein